jgi:type II secretory pathway predicted ATPase ExeA
MYYAHFGLTQPPFKITPDTRLFFPGANRGEVLQALIYAIVNGEGIVKVVGEVGSGKTMLCRMLEVELPEHVDMVYLANPSVAPEHILHAIAFELKLPVSTGDDRLRVLQTVQEYLLKKHADNRRVVVFIEEAQAMPVATLEEIRLLSNLETGQDKLLQIVLFGQPELDRTLARHDIRQLKERITYSFALTPFSTEEIHDYINSRLRASGHRAGEVFTKGAIRAITRYSRGLVRRVNIVADKAMLAAYAVNATRVLPKHVHVAARDSEFEVERPWKTWAAAAALATVLVGGGGWFIWSPAPSPDTAAVAAASPASGPVAAPAAEQTAAKAPEAVVAPAAQPELPDDVSITLAPANEPAPTDSEPGAITVARDDETTADDAIRAQLLPSWDAGLETHSLLNIDNIVSATDGGLVHP